MDHFPHSLVVPPTKGNSHIGLPVDYTMSQQNARQYEPKVIPSPKLYKRKAKVTYMKTPINQFPPQVYVYHIVALSSTDVESSSTDVQPHPLMWNPHPLM